MGVGRKCSAVDDRLEEEALESRCATDNYLDGGKIFIVPREPHRTWYQLKKQLL